MLLAKYGRMDVGRVRNGYISFTWRGILKGFHVLHSNLMWKLNICERVLSWKDNWLGVELYKRVFCNRYLRRRKGSTSLAFSDHWSLIRGGKS